MARDQVELFYLGDEIAPCGAVVTESREDRVSCRVRFSTPDGQPAGGEAAIRVDRSIWAWTDFEFISDGQRIRGTRDHSGVTVAGDRVHYAGVAVPSYGLSALVLELVAGPDRAAEFGLLDESAPPADAVEPARLLRVGTEAVSSPLMGLVPGCERVELTVGERRTNTYWVSDGVMVASDWAGARSFALPVPAADGLRVALGLQGPADESSATATT